LQPKVAKPLPNSLFLPYRNFKEDIKSGKTINEMMEFQFNVIEMVEKCIRVVNIQESIADLEVPPTVQNELKALMKDLIEGKTTAQQERRIAEEDEEDYIKTIARHEKELSRLDDRIKRLREDVTELQTQQKATQNELVEGK
jgi:vacuolar-type H+-ATPase subunit I/STV1